MHSQIHVGFSAKECRTEKRIEKKCPMWLRLFDEEICSRLRNKFLTSQTTRFFLKWIGVNTFHIFLGPKSILWGNFYTTMINGKMNTISGLPTQSQFYSVLTKIVHSNKREINGIRLEKIHTRISTGKK